MARIDSRPRHLRGPGIHLAGGCGHHPYRPQETNAMNWILGLKRLWAVASIALIVRIFNNGPRRVEDLCRDYDDWWSGRSLPDCGPAIWQTIFEGAVLAVALPIAMYLAGAALVWVVRGFRQKAHQP